MAKSEHQKAKLCHLAEILAKYTDEEHGMTTSQLINALAALGIGAERKSIYDDIRTLQDFGMDIVTRRSKTTEYFLASREFELPELKLLVDAISASRFVTKKKSLALIEKLEKLTSVHEAGKLRRQLVLTGRSKSQNVAAVLGSALNLKPVISCGDDGVYHVVAKALGRNQSVKKVMELAAKFAGTDPCDLAVMDSRAPQEALLLKMQSILKIPKSSILAEGDISPALIVHTGPGLVGIGVLKK